MPEFAPDRLTEDKFLNGLIVLKQPQSGFRAGLDSVFLAAAVPAKPKDQVLELGMGAGAAALCLAARLPGVDVTGLELSAGMAQLAENNCADNGLADRVTVVQGDVTNPPDIIKNKQFDHVMLNPPFDRAGSGRVSPDSDKALANQEGTGSLDAFLSLAVKRIKSDGTITVVHRAERLDEIMCGLKSLSVGDLTIVPLWPRAGAQARRVIVQGRKGARGGAHIMAGLVLHEGTDSHNFTKQAEAILRHAAPLTF